MNITRKFLTAFLPISLLLFSHCGLLDEMILTEEPTQKRMQGIWMVTEATDESGEDIMSKINFPATVFQLGNDNSLNSTAGPMATYLVYGSNNYATVASKIDQIFDYTKLDPDDGEWFIENGVVSRFTMYFKLISLPGTSSLSNLLEFFNVHIPLLRQVIYHKFFDVKVSFESDDIMIWEFDDQTTTDYYTVDGKGERVPISISTDQFSHARFVLTKQVKNLQDLISEAAQK